MPDNLQSDQTRLDALPAEPQCCDDPSVIEPDVLSKERDKFEASGDDRYVEKAHRRGE